MFTFQVRFKDDDPEDALVTIDILDHSNPRDAYIACLDKAIQMNHGSAPQRIELLYSL